MKALSRTFAALTLFASVATAGGDLVAVRVGRAETVSQGTIEHAVILIEDGKIVTIGQDLPVDRGIPTVDRPNWTVIPGLVNAYSRYGLRGQGGAGSDPESMASNEIYARDAVFEDLAEFGFTTLGVYAPGTGIPGQAVAIRPIGDTLEELIVRDHAYLKILLSSNATSKKMLRDGFESVDKFDEKEAKNLEKWEKAKEKAEKKKKKSKKDDEKEEEDEKEEKVGDYEPLVPDANVQAFIQVRSGELSVLFSIRTASDYIHLIDAIGEEEFEWSLRVPLRDDGNLFEVTERIGELEKRLIVEPNLTLEPGTRNSRNLPRELANAGAKMVFIPRRDSTAGHRDLRVNIAELIVAGFDRDAALRAITLEPATVLGLQDQIGSLEAGKDANLVFLNGDPFEGATQIEAVMLDGKVVFGELN